MAGCCKVAGAVVLLVALLLKPVILPALVELRQAPADYAIGSIPILSAAELSAAYSGRRVLVVGGTRGIGRGTAVAMAQAGAHVTVVGRSQSSGETAMAGLRAAAPTRAEQELEFLRGDIGTAASAHRLVAELERRAASSGGFDYLVVTAAVFPDWGGELFQEDGLEKGFAIAALGRFLVYRGMPRFMNSKGLLRVLNVLASGSKVDLAFDRTLASGKREPTWLVDAIMCWALATEMMQIGLDRHGLSFGTTRVSTHPGILVTDLHRNQGWFMDLVEPVMVALAGFSEQEAGARQASILASPKLHPGALSYVDMSMQGRLADASLTESVAEHLEWLWALLEEKAGLVQKAS